MIKFNFLNTSRISKLPKETGVYAFYDKKVLLYIGKATNIKERVKNHFQQPKSLWEQALLRPTFTKVSAGKQGFEGRIGFIKTQSEIEALLLEAELIKKYQPKYNVAWRDDKNYFYVGLTREAFPQIFITHQPKLKIVNCKLKISYVGPFVDGKALKETLKFLRKVFPFRSCRFLPKKSCLWYHLNRCPAPCTLKSPAVERSAFTTGQAKILGSIPVYSLNIAKEAQKDAALLFGIISGKKPQVLKNLKKEMKIASKNQDFEKAKTIRDKIFALEKVLSNAKIFGLQISPQINKWKNTQRILGKIIGAEKISRLEAYDVSNIQGQEASGSMVVFSNGQPDKSQYRKFKIKIAGRPNDTAMIKEILTRRFGHPEWRQPDLILIDGGKGQLNAAIEIKNSKIKSQNYKSKLKILSLAKKKNELFIEGKKNSILLKTLPREIFNVILHLRDEAHRFAIVYHKKLREVDFIPNN